MQFLDKTGVGTLWSMCKTKFALKDHSHNYLPLSGGTLTGDLLFSNSGTTFRQIRGTCGDNDFWRIGGGATGNNAGYMEIATADDGTEPIYVRQYSGTFSTITRTATLLDGSGNTSFPGTVAAAKFKGALEGNASTATNADTVDGYHASSLWKSDGGIWNPGANISLTASGNDQEWSFDIRRNGYTGCYWHVWDSALNTLLKVNADNGKVYAPYNFVGNLEGNASTASNASAVNGHTVNANVPSNAKFTDTNTWRPIQDNLTSTSTSESLSANQGRILKGLVDGKANSSHTHSWSQISGVPATATRWPSWGEVTSKPDLKNWSETKSYIDNKTASSGGVDSLPIGTELMSYNGSNIFGDKFVKEDGKYYKRSETSFDFGPIKSINPDRKYIETNTEEGSTVLIYFNGYYYTKKYNKWCKSQTIDGQFSEAPELKDYSDYGYIGNGAFYNYFDSRVIILGGSQYSVPNRLSISYYKNGYFLTQQGITKDFETYTNPEHGTFSLCENEGYFWVEDSTNYYLCIYDYTGKLLAKSKYSYNDNLGSFRKVAYCKATNTAYVSTYVNSTHSEGIIYFDKNTAKMNQCSDNVYRNTFASIVISAVKDSEEFTVSDCYENFQTYKFSTKGLQPYYKLQIFSISILNGVTYVRCRYHSTNYNNYDCRHLIEITGLYSSDIYCQAKNSPSTFVKVK